MNTRKIAFGNGCFWCTVAILETLKGVNALRSHGRWPL
ncbi:peptide-methionine (S)-S-oxide reductase [Mucilaginibacter sp.]